MTQAPPVAWDCWDGREVPPAALLVVRQCEGYRNVPYLDSAGVPTIGIGTTRINGKPVTMNTPPITLAQAEAFLAADMAGAAADVNRLVKVDLRHCEAAALITWTYNLGAGNLGQSGALKAINEGRKADVPANWRQWVNAGGKPSLGLLRRRWAESAIFLGKDPQEAITVAWRDIKTLSDWPNITT